MSSMFLSNFQEFAEKISQIMPQAALYATDREVFINKNGFDVPFVKVGEPFAKNGPADKVIQTGRQGSIMLAEKYLEQNLYTEFLVSQACAGHQKPFEDLVLLMRPEIKSICKKYYHGSLESDDLEQEALIALYQAVQSYKPGKGSFNFYAKLIINRKLCSAIRSAKRQKHESLNRALSLDQPKETDATLYSFISDGINHEEVITDNLCDNLLLSGVKLTPFENTVFELYLQHKSYSEIISRTGRNYKSIDNAMFRIRKKLKRAHAL